MKKTDIFQKSLEELNITLTNKQIDQFYQYYEILIEWNKVMNLTGITEYEQVVIKHFIDSLALVKAVDLESNLKIIDLGTGAGFPGIPLKIAFPQLNILLLDSLNKRIKFLDEVINRLGLNYIYAIHGRAEELIKKEGYRGGFDLCVSRAVANLSTLSEYCIPYVKLNGMFIPYKSGNIKEELEEAKGAVHILGGKILGVEEFSLPNTDIDRSFVLIKKVKDTPKKYPRNGGKPLKEPLSKK